MTTQLTTSAMIASLADPGQKTASAPFGHALAALAEQDQRMIGLTADLGKYTDMHIFAQAHPENPRTNDATTTGASPYRRVDRDVPSAMARRHADQVKRPGST